MTRIMTVVGTRPEIIRLSRVITWLDQHLDHVLVHTGQNYDPLLSDVFFTELGLRAPDRFLQPSRSSLARTFGGMLAGVEDAISDLSPDAVVILGDTNSCVATALISRRMKVPVYHMEAGNRCFDLNVPEETNRRIVDHTADFNLVYTEHARRNLIAEGISSRRIMYTGSPMREVLNHYQTRISDSKVLSRLDLQEGRFFLASAHREETVDRPDRLTQLLSCLQAVAKVWQLPILFSTHPRTRKQIEQSTPDPSLLEGISFHEPFGLIDYICLQRAARCVLSDSGTISEEAAILGFPAITLRDSIERPESLDTGAILMTGLDPTGTVEAVKVSLDDRARWTAGCPADYCVEDTSRRVGHFILSTVRRHHEWAGIRP